MFFFLEAAEFDDGFVFEEAKGVEDGQVEGGGQGEDEFG